MVTGKWLYPNNTCFEGAFNNNKPKGTGKWHFANGNVVEGVYQQTRKAQAGAGDDIKLAWTTKSDITVGPVVIE